LNYDNGKLILDSTFTTTAKIAMEGEKVPIEVEIGIIRVPINAVVWIEEHVSVVISADGGVQLAISTNSQTGVEYTKSEGFKPICIVDPAISDITYNGALGLYVQSSAKLKVFGIKSSEVGGRAGVELNGELKVISDQPKQTCCDVKISLAASLFAQIGPDYFNIRKTIPIGAVVLGNLHIEETGIVPKCTRSEKDKGSYAGLVTDSITHTPISYARIELLQEGALIETIFSDANGSFKGTKKKPGSYTLCVSAPFYNESESRITIETGKDTTFEIALKPEKVSKSPWTATVISAESGELIENAKLEIILDNTRLAEIHTDTNGHGSGLLPVGTYTVRISHPKYKARTETIEIEENKTADFSWELTPTSEETGERMYGYLECPAINGYNPESGVGRIPFGTIEFYDASSQLISSVTADENGYYECDVPENCYSYKAYGEKCLKSESSYTPLFTSGGSYDFELKPKTVRTHLRLSALNGSTIYLAYVKITAVESDYFTEAELVYSDDYYFMDSFSFDLPIGTYQISVTNASYLSDDAPYKAEDKEEIFTIRDDNDIFYLRVFLEPTYVIDSDINEVDLLDEAALVEPEISGETDLTNSSDVLDSDVTNGSEPGEDKNESGEISDGGAENDTNDDDEINVRQPGDDAGDVNGDDMTGGESDNIADDGNGDDEINASKPDSSADNMNIDRNNSTDGDNEDARHEADTGNGDDKTSDDME